MYFRFIIQNDDLHIENVCTDRNFVGSYRVQYNTYRDSSKTSMKMKSMDLLLYVGLYNNIGG